MSPNAFCASGSSLDAEITCGSRSQRSSSGTSSIVTGRSTILAASTSDMTARPVACGVPFARTVDRHLGVDFLAEVPSDKRNQPVKQDGDIRGFAPDLGDIAGADRLVELVEFATRTRNQRGEVGHLSERRISPRAD